MSGIKGPCLNVELDYFDHPKTKRLVGMLGRGAAELPIRLWCYCGRHLAASGNLAGHSAAEIETVVGWWGTAGKAVEAMVKVGFLDVVEGGWQCHDWQGYEGHIVAYHERAQKAAQARWAKHRAKGNAPDATSNAVSNAQAMLKQCSSVRSFEEPPKSPLRGDCGQPVDNPGPKIIKDIVTRGNPGTWVT